MDGADRTLCPNALAQRIARAVAYYRSHGERLRADKDVALLLGKLAEAVRRSRKTTVEIGLAAECARCDDQGGSCCGAGIENRYDAVTLLINLLLGGELPSCRRDPRSCVFLGPDGCLLGVREVLCINYLCPKLVDRLRPHDIGLLNAAEAEEIECLCRLHARLVNLLGTIGDA